MHEGLAVELSSYRRISDPLLFWGRGPIHLTELVDAFPVHDARARMAYLESGAAAHRLLQLGDLQKFLDRIANGVEFAEAFAVTYGMPWRQFAEEVHGEVGRRWRLLMAIASSTTLFAVLTLLFLAVGTRRMGAGSPAYASMGRARCCRGCASTPGPATEPRLVIPPGNCFRQILRPAVNAGV